MSVYTKSPAAILDYELVWDDYLDDTNDQIASAVWTAKNGITLSQTAFTSTETSVRISGGAMGKQYWMTTKITMTPSGQVDERTLTINVEGT